MKTREKIILSVTVTIVFFSFLIIPIMTEVSVAIGKYPSAEHASILDMLTILFYTHVVTFLDQFYFAGWYVGYSLHLPNPSMEFARYLNSITDTPLTFIFASSVFSYLEAPPWDALYVIPAMYLPLILIVPMWFFSKGMLTWRRIFYAYVVVVQFSTILRMVLLFTL